MQRSGGFSSVREALLQLIPKEARVTRVEFEGPEVCLLYTSPSPRDS